MNRNEIRPRQLLAINERSLLVRIDQRLVSADAAIAAAKAMIPRRVFVCEHGYSICVVPSCLAARTVWES